MIRGLYFGLSDGRGGLHGGAALLANLALLLQFPLVHSVLLASRGRALLARLAPAGLGPALSTTTFALISSWQLAATFLLWSPSGVVLWQARGGWWLVCSLLYAASWLVVQKAIWDGGLALQTGFLGWSAVWRGHPPRYRPFAEGGLFRYCRQPIYLGFSLTLWTGPILTLDRLLLALVWTGYCLAAPRWKEARYLARYGEDFRRYQRRVPYWLPRPLRGGPREGES